MSCEYALAGEGKRFVLTAFGAEDPRIRSKFVEGTSRQKQYEKRAPKKWLEKGLIQEVKI